MALGVAAFAAYSALSQPSETDRRYFEADASGQLREVERAGVPSAPPPPLWKPEPQWLLERAADLSLTAPQRERIDSIAKGWQVIKEDLESKLKLETEFLSARAKGTSVGSVQSGLEGYSSLSREFGRQREAAWQAALAVLDENQRTRLAQLSEESK